MPTTIHVERKDSSHFRVTVAKGSGQSEYTVSLKPAYYEKLTEKQIPEEELIERSFRFLLERESRQSILREFDLPVIGRYFPDYEKEIQKSLGG